MVQFKQIGVFRGRELVQKKGSVGGSRNVFVKLQGIKNELVYPTFGGVIANPFKGAAKIFAGDLMEYRTNEDGVKPSIYILKTYEVLAGDNTNKTYYIKRDGYRHIPFVGDRLMIAPEIIGGFSDDNLGGTVTEVEETTHTISSTTYNVWKIKTDSALFATNTIVDGTVLVEADADNSMLVKTINAVADCDADMFDYPSYTFGSNGDTNFEDARYFYTPALGGLMYINKMSVLPQCVLDMNPCNVNGWFKVDCFGMDRTATVESYAIDQHINKYHPE